MKVVAIILAAGQGKRMGTEIPKQYLIVKERPVLYHTLNAFMKSEVDEIILVVGKNEIEYCQKEYIEGYGFHKITSIMQGGAERYHSVYNGLSRIQEGDYVLIHDGARPCITVEEINYTIQEVKENQAVVLGVPSKDTIKVVDRSKRVVDTPNREYLWLTQTPQAFRLDLINEAYAKLMKQEDKDITDDAMVVERMLGVPVKMIQGSYRNIKITTIEDLKLAEIFLP